MPDLFEGERGCGSYGAGGYGTGFLMGAYSVARDAPAPEGSIGSLRGEPRRNAGGVRYMKSRTWGAEIRVLEDFAAEFGGEASMFDRLCEFVSSGGLVSELCAEFSVNAGVLLAWIRKDAERSKRYDQAIADRKMCQAEQPVRVWRDVMDSEPEEAPEWKDVLKASELMAKHAGALRDGAGSVTVNAGAGSLIAVLSGLDVVPSLPPVQEKEPIDVTPDVVPEPI